jgi:uncharacterized delta-60 repeat protein
MVHYPPAGSVPEGNQRMLLAHPPRPLVIAVTIVCLSRPWCLGQVEEVWAARYGSTVDGNDQANAVAVDGAGNVYVTGKSGTRQTTLKYSPEGRELWAATYVPEIGSFDCPSGLAVDDSGNVYIHPIDGPYALVKYSAAGTQVWAARSGELGVADVADLIVDDTGDLLVVGSEFVTVKYAKDGRKLWTAHDEDIGHGEAFSSGAALDGAGNVYILGAIGSRADLVKRGSDGSLRWWIQYSDQRWRPRDLLAVDGAGNAYIVIRNQGMIDDAYLTLKFSPEGKKLWETRYLGPLGRSNNAAAIALDPEGNICITGSSSSGRAPGSSVDFATVKYDPEGNELWTARYTRPGYGSDIARSIAVDASGEIYVTGYSFASGITTLKYSPEGAELWSSFDQATWCDYYADSAQVLAVDPEGNSYLSVVRDRDFVTQKRGPDGQVLWEARYNSRILGFDQATAIQVDAEGNVHVAGFAGDGFGTIKYSPDGGEVWSAHYDAPGRAGESDIQLNLDPAGDVLVSGKAGLDVATIKYGRQGEVRWVTRISPPGIPARSAFTIDGSGNSYVVVSSLNYCGFEGCQTGEFTTTKLDLDGRQLWAQQFHTGGQVIDSAAAIAVGPSGNIHVAGDSAPCHDTGTWVNCARADLVLATYDPDGTLLWDVRKAIVADFYDARAIAIGPDGGVHVAGSLNGNFLTHKFTSDGRELWEAEFSPEMTSLGPSSIAVDPAGSVLVAGPIKNIAGEIAYAVIKYDTDGREVWRATGDGPSGGVDFGSPRIALDPAGNVFLVGRSGTEFATMKFDAAGRLAWIMSRPGETWNGGAASAVALDSAGNVLVTGGIDGEFVTVKYRQVPSQKFVRGDCNGDDDTGGLTDAVFLLAYLFLAGEAPPCRAACDANGDGDLSGVTDAVFLLAHLFLAGPAPAPPFPGCGPPGPRDPMLGCAAGPPACR